MVCQFEMMMFAYQRFSLVLRKFWLVWDSELGTVLTPGNTLSSLLFLFHQLNAQDNLNWQGERLNSSAILQFGQLFSPKGIFANNAENGIWSRSTVFALNTGISLKHSINNKTLTHLSEIATADMQMLCNIFPILSMQLMKGSSFEQVLVLRKKNVFFVLFFIIIILPYMGMHDSQWSVTIWTNSQSSFNSRIDMKTW